MITKDALPDEFRAEVFPQYVYHATASAVISTQYVEKVLNGICTALRSCGVLFSVDDFMSEDATRASQTLGTIERHFRRTDLFDRSFLIRLNRFSRRRNRLVHNLFADTFRSLDDIHITSGRAQSYVAECEWVTTEAAELVETGFGIFRALGEVLLGLRPDDLELARSLSYFERHFETGLRSMSASFRSRL